jgi:hypothetical protein
MNKTFLLVVLGSTMQQLSLKVQDAIVAENEAKALEGFGPTIRKYKLDEHGNEFRVVEKGEYNKKVNAFFEKL